MTKAQWRLFYYGPVIAWMGLIFAMSTGIGNAEHTIGLLGRLIWAYMPDAAPYFGPVQLEYLNYFVRKLGHVTEYMILTALTVRALQFGNSRLHWRSVVGGLLLSICYAISDEFHQYFVPSRTASPKDVLIDSSGAIVCAVVIACWFGIKEFERRRIGLKSDA